MRIGSRLSVYCLTGMTGCLALLLCWGFSPFGASTKSVITLVTVILMAGLMLWGRRHDVFIDETTRLENLPEISFSQPVVLVCGDKLDALFGETTVRITPLACYVKTDIAKPLSIFVDAVLSQRPGWIRQMAVLYSVSPEIHADEAVCRAAIKSWRQQFYRLQKRIGCRIPVLVSCWLNGTASPWFVGAADGKMIVRDDDEGATRLSDWLSSSDINMQPARQSQAICLEAACSWLRDVVLDEMQHPETLSTPVRPVAVGVRFDAVSGVPDNLWSAALTRRTTLNALTPLQSETVATLPFPDPLLPLLSGTTRHIRAGLAPVIAVILMMCFAVTAIGSVVNNNHRLITRIGMDLKRYRIRTGNVTPRLMRQRTAF